MVDKILSLSKTFWFNFRYLPFRKARFLPVWVRWNARIRIKGRIEIDCDKINMAMIRIGFHKVPVCDERDTTSLIVHGTLVFCGTAHIGRGSKLYVGDSGILRLGDNFAISASSSINCYKSIVFGRDIQFSWDCLVMDSDTHYIYGDDGLMNEDRAITFGDKVWIGCRSLILKGCRIPSNTVIAAGTSVIGGGKKCLPNSVIGGCPAKSIKDIKSWEI